MIRIRSHSIFKLITFLFLIIYAFCVLTNILALPNRASLSKNIEIDWLMVPNQVMAIKADKDLTSKKEVRLIDRSIVTKVQPAQVPVLLLLLFVFTGLSILKAKALLIPQFAYLSFDKQYSYLYFLTFRI